MPTCLWLRLSRAGCAHSCATARLASPALHPRHPRLLSAARTIGLCFAPPSPPTRPTRTCATSLSCSCSCCAASASPSASSCPRPATGKQLSQQPARTRARPAGRLKPAGKGPAAGIAACGPGRLSSTRPCSRPQRPTGADTPPPGVCAELGARPQAQSYTHHSCTPTPPQTLPPPGPRARKLNVMGIAGERVVVDNGTSVGEQVFGSFEVRLPEELSEEQARCYVCGRTFAHAPLHCG